MKFSIFIAVALVALPFAAQAETVRTSVGIPLRQAELLIQRHDYTAALRVVGKAAAAGHLTPYEAVVVAQVRGIAAAGAGDYTEAAGAYETVLNSGTMPLAAKTQYLQAIAGFFYQTQNYLQTVTWVSRYIAAGGKDPRTRALLAQSYYQEGDFKDAEQIVWREQKVAGAQALPESELQLLANSAEKTGDQAGYEAALEVLLETYPNLQYWAAAIALVTASSDFPDRLTLDVYRLRRATGTLTAPGDYEDYAERAILAGDPAEANAVITQGFSLGILTEQTDGGHASRLRILAAKDSASAPAAIQEIRAEQSSDPGLDLGIAYYQTGQYVQATKAFKMIRATSSAAPLARLWTIYVGEKR